MTAVRQDFFGASARLHHMGLAVRSLDAIVPEAGATADPVQRVRVAFVTIGDCAIELIEPTDKDSPVQKSIELGRKLVHVCFEVDDITAVLEGPAARTFKVLQQPVSAPAFENRYIVWLYHPVWGLVELLERKR